MGSTTSAASSRSAKKTDKTAVVSGTIDAVKKGTTAYDNATSADTKQKDSLPIKIAGKNKTVTSVLSYDDWKNNVGNIQSAYQYVTTPVKLTVTDATGATKVTVYSGFFIPKGKDTPGAIALKQVGVSNSGTAPEPQDPMKYKWNLPPHKWSRPLWKSKDPNFTPDGTPHSPGNDMYRRGRIWHKADDPSQILYDQTGSQISKGFREWGFQFTWNPDSFKTSVAVQMDATPNSKDRFLAVAGAFPATETVSFTVILDRTNDFADLYGKLVGNSGELLVPSGVAQVGAKNYISPTFITSKISQDAFAAEDVDNYKMGFNASKGDEYVREQLADLMMRGTVADVEYLYRAINGSGPGGGASSWVNGRGVQTSDIGYLMPTLLNVDIGPLSYQGYVTNLSVVHTGFTPNMIPIRTTLDISLNVLATSGVSTDYAQKQKQNSTN